MDVFKCVFQLNFLDARTPPPWPKRGALSALIHNWYDGIREIIPSECSFIWLISRIIESRLSLSSENSIVRHSFPNFFENPRSLYPCFPWEKYDRDMYPVTRISLFSHARLRTTARYFCNNKREPVVGHEDDRMWRRSLSWRYANRESSLDVQRFLRD